MTYCRECIWGNGVNEDGHPVPLGFLKGICKSCGAAPTSTGTSACHQQGPSQFDAATDRRRTRTHSISSRSSSRPTLPSHESSGRSTPVAQEHTPQSSQRSPPLRQGPVSSQASSRSASGQDYPVSEYSSTIGSQVSYLSGHRYPISGGRASSVAPGRSPTVLSMLSTRQAHVGGYRPPSVESSATKVKSRATSLSGRETGQDAYGFNGMVGRDPRPHAESSRPYQRRASMSCSSTGSNDGWRPKHILHVRSAESSAGRPSLQALQPELKVDSTTIAPSRGAPSQYVPEPFHGALYTGPVPVNVPDQPLQRSRRLSTSSSPAFGDRGPSPSAPEGEQNGSDWREHGRGPSIPSGYSGIDSIYSAALSTAHSQSDGPKRDRRRSISTMHSAACSARPATASSRAQSRYHRAQHAGGDRAGVEQTVASYPSAHSPQDAGRFTYNGFMPAHGNTAASSAAVTAHRAPTPSQKDRNGYAFPAHSVIGSSTTSQMSQPYNRQVSSGSSNVAQSAPGGSIPTTQQHRTSILTHCYPSSTAGTPIQDQYTHFPTYQERARPAPLAQSITAAKVLSHLASQETTSVGDGQMGTSNADAWLKSQGGSAAQHDPMVGSQLAAGLATMSIRMAGGTEVKIIEGSKGAKGRRMSFVIEG